MSGGLFLAHGLAVAAAYFVALVIMAVHMSVDSGDGRAVAFLAFWGVVISIAMVPLLFLLALPVTIGLTWFFGRLSITHPVPFVVAGAALSIATLVLMQLLALLRYSAPAREAAWQQVGQFDWTTALTLAPAGAVGGWVLWRSYVSGRRS